MRFPSKGIGFLSGCKRGSAMTFFMPSSRALREGQVIQEKTTVSSSLRLTAMGNDVTLPSGTSSPNCPLPAWPRGGGDGYDFRGNQSRIGWRGGRMDWARILAYVTGMVDQE